MSLKQNGDLKKRKLPIDITYCLLNSDFVKLRFSRKVLKFTKIILTDPTK